MRVTAIVAAIATCALIGVAHTAEADALSPVELSTEDSSTLLEDIAYAEKSDDKPATEVAEEDSEEVEKEPQLHVVKKGEHLSSIARQYDTTWQRLFFKNENISHPDQLKIDQELTIPEAEETLTERPIPLPPQPAPAPEAPTPSRTTNNSSSQQPRQTATRSQSSSPRTAPRGNSSGNLYTYGYCTWYVKNRRPDLPNNLGNAITWASRAAAQGIPTGSTPRVGAVGQSGNHVVYVESVNGDGTVTVSEMNWKGWNISSTRTAAASSFRYIY